MTIDSGKSLNRFFIFLIYTKQKTDFLESAFIIFTLLAFSYK